MEDFTHIIKTNTRSYELLEAETRFHKMVLWFAMLALPALSFVRGVYLPIDFDPIGMRLGLSGLSDTGLGLGCTPLELPLQFAF